MTTKKRNTQQLSFIPESEQPYKLPDNWRWVKMGELYELNPKNTADDTTLAAFIPMEKIAPGMVNNFTFDIQPWGKIKKGHTHFANNDVAFAKIAPCFENRKSMILADLENGIGAGTTELIILRNPEVESRYTFWLVSGERFIDGGIKTYSGTVGQQRISMDYVKNYPVPLPPLPEQRRIVERIESLFSKLDEARTKAQNVADNYEARRASILHRAFTGELTAKWREENGITQAWVEKHFRDIGETKLGKMLDDAKNTGDKTLYLRNANVRWFNFDLNDIAVMLASQEERDKLAIKNGDLLICEGGEPGRCAVWTQGSNTYIFQKALHRFRPHGETISQFVAFYLYYLNSNGSLQKYFTGTTIKHLTGKALANVPIIIPSLSEQTKIVQLLDALLSKERSVYEAATAVIERIDVIKKAILACAFCGKLRTNDLKEPSSI